MYGAIFGLYHSGVRVKLIGVDSSSLDMQSLPDIVGTANARLPLSSFPGIFVLVSDGADGFVDDVDDVFVLANGRVVCMLPSRGVSSSNDGRNEVF